MKHKNPVATVPSKDVLQNIGVYKIKGMVTQLSISLPCRLRLYEKSSGQLVGELVSDIDGRYEFGNLKNIKHFIVAHHPSSQFNAVIQDNVVPK